MTLSTEESASAGELYAQGRRLDAAPAALGLMRPSDDVADDPKRLQERLALDGYLYVPGVLDRDEVLAARHAVLHRLAAEGRLAPGSRPEDAVPGPDLTNAVRDDLAQETPELRSVLYAGRMPAFFQRLFGEPVRHFDYTWLRPVPPGLGTAPHGDSVFMNRGTANLLTCWVPLGDVDLDLGGLLVLEGSHRLEDVRRDYHTRDVDTYCDNTDRRPTPDAPVWTGFYAMDPVQLRSQTGLRWVTSRFRAGDLVTFPMFTLHGSLDNTSSRVRLSCDIRYQRASEPADPRWVGPAPAGHGPDSKVGLIC